MTGPDVYETLVFNFTALVSVSHRGKKVQIIGVSEESAVSFLRVQEKEK